MFSGAEKSKSIKLWLNPPPVQIHVETPVHADEVKVHLHVEQEGNVVCIPISWRFAARNLLSVKIYQNLSKIVKSSQYCQKLLTQPRISFSEKVPVDTWTLK